jgi:hypothetical protein
MTTLYAWLFDAYPSDAGMTTWWIDADGHAHALRDDLTPAFYVRGPRADLHDLCLWLRAQAGAKHAVSHRRAAGLRGTNGASPLRFAYRLWRYFPRQPHPPPLGLRLRSSLISGV